MLLRRLALFIVALGSARCATPHRASYVAAPKVLSQGGLIQVLDATGYLSYQTPTPVDLPGYRFVRRARGEVCQNDLRLPLHLEGSHANAALSGAQTLDIAWGNAAVAQAVADAMLGAPVGAVLYDLTLDLHRTSVLGLFFRQQCLVVSGSLALPWAAPAKAAAAQEAGGHQGEPAPAADALVDGAPLQPIPLAPVPTCKDQVQAPKKQRPKSGAHKSRSSRGHSRSKRGGRNHNRH